MSLLLRGMPGNLDLSVSGNMQSPGCSWSLPCPVTPGIRTLFTAAGLGGRWGHA